MKNIKQHILLAIALTTLAISPPLAAQTGVGSSPSTNPSPPRIETTQRISLTPMSPSTPALKYRLTWPYADQISGNAATSYLMACGYVQNGDDQQDQYIDKMYEILEKPLNQIDPTEAQKVFVEPFLTVLSLVEQASKSDRCDWGLPLRQEGFRVMFPYLSPMRTIAIVIAAQAKVNIAKGDMEGAAKMLRIGYTMSKHLDQQACLIQGLVESSMNKTYNEVLLEWIQSDKTPNLYWAIANLPNPLIDVRSIMEMERAMQIYTIPVLQDIKTKPITPETWREFSAITMELMPMTGSKSPMPGRGGTLDTTLFDAAAGVIIYPTAKDYLKNHGYTDDRLKSMTAPQILLQYMSDSLEQTNDETLKWVGLPCWQAIPALEQLSQRFKKEPKILGLVVLSPPSVFSTVISRFGEVQRQVELMRTLEALRAYAAANNGKLPETLADMSQTPPPIDPFTGKPFEWQLDGAKGTLSKAKVPWHVTDKVEKYEITIRK